MYFLRWFNTEDLVSLSPAELKSTAIAIVASAEAFLTVLFVYPVVCSS
jgi:hypothetical protein